MYINNFQKGNVKKEKEKKTKYKHTSFWENRFVYFVFHGAGIKK